jgi:hypothetical protein
MQSSTFINNNGLLHVFLKPVVYGGVAYVEVVTRFQ